MPESPRSRRRPKAGFTLVEVLLALAVLVVAVGGTLGTLNAYVRLDQQTAQKSMALRVAEERIERLRAEPFSMLFERYNAETADDPTGFFSSPGNGFAVPGLDMQDGDADGLAGEIFFPVDPSAPGVLREDITDSRLGTPKDLNRDGVIDSLDHRLDHVLLPVRVEVRWTGPAGMQSVTLDSLLSPR